MPLTPDKIRLLEPRAKIYKLHDSKGLFLAIMPSGGKCWRYRYKFNGKENLISCGCFPSVSIEDARIKRDEFSVMLLNGINPADSIKQERANKARKQTPTKFNIDSHGGLSVRIGHRNVDLTPDETNDLRAFLIATSNITQR
jgi:hypothetical protein